MSFGFKKKFSSSSSKKNANILSNKEKEKEKSERSATVITNPGVIQTDNLLSDNNGNTGNYQSTWGLNPIHYTFLTKQTTLNFLKSYN